MNHINAYVQYIGKIAGLIEEKIGIQEALKKIEEEAGTYEQVACEADEFTKKLAEPERLQEVVMRISERELQIYRAILCLEKLGCKTREDFWATYAQNPARITQIFKSALQKFDLEENSPGHAVELGCGHSMSAICLLKKGWNVTVVDSSPVAIEILKKIADQTNPQWIKKKKLKLVCSKMETYNFPKNVKLILAVDSLCYCNPNQIKNLWDKAYESLEKGGRIVGNFASRPRSKDAEFFVRVFSGSWFTEKPVVQALLSDKGYQIEACQYSKYWFQSGPELIEFIGLK